jgi:hypothetical protein
MHLPSPHQSKILTCLHLGCSVLELLQVSTLSFFSSSLSLAGEGSGVNKIDELERSILLTRISLVNSVVSSAK